MAFNIQQEGLEDCVNRFIGMLSFLCKSTGRGGALLLGL